MKNYYQILQVNKNASPEIIEKAYRVLAKKYHPDVQPRDKLFWAEINFREISEAYKVLSNNSLKAEYDMKLKLNNSIQQSHNYSYINQINNQPHTDSTSQKENVHKKKLSNTRENIFKKEILASFKEIISSIPSLIRAEFKKPPAERSKDIKALILTIIIVSILIFIFIKVPFLNKLLFP